MHMTIEVPLSPVYSGQLLGKARAQTWDSRFKSRIDFESLEKSGLDIVVAALFVNSVWGDVEKQLDDQIKVLNDFCVQHKNWIIVSEPKQAENELTKGNNIIILSIEGAWFFKDKDLFNRIMEKYPIRIVTPIHFTDFREVIGKSADQRGLSGFLQKIFRFIFGTTEKLSEIGKEVFKVLLEKKVWIDLSHSSKPALEYFLQIKPDGYPLLMTHTVLGKYYGTERGVDENFLKMLVNEPGLIGLLPSTEMLVGTPQGNSSDCQKNNPFFIQWNEIQSLIGSQKIYLGSDLNSPIPFMPNSCPGQKDWVTAADLSRLIKDENSSSTAYFLKMWKIARPERPDYQLRRE